MLARLMADILVLVHVSFVLFVVFGALLIFRWKRVIWLHIPAALWGVVIEWADWICPLTPLENQLRMMGDQAGYSGGFIEHYLLPVLYPAGMSRGVRIALGLFVLAVNAGIYRSIRLQSRRRRKESRVKTG